MCLTDASTHIKSETKKKKKKRKLAETNRKEEAETVDEKSRT